MSGVEKTGMKMRKMKNIVLTALLAVVTLAGLQAQAGMRLYGGVSLNMNESAVLMSDGPTAGYHIGADMRLNEGGMYFVLGGRFTNTGYTSNESLYRGDNPQLQTVNVRVGLGYTLFSISDKIKLRAKTLGSIDYAFNEPVRRNTAPEAVREGISEIAEGFEEYRGLNSTASLIAGLGVSVGALTFDVEYGFGLFNQISNNKDTVPSHLSASVGFFF